MQSVGPKSVLASRLGEEYVLLQGPQGEFFHNSKPIMCICARALLFYCYHAAMIAILFATFYSADVLYIKCVPCFCLACRRSIEPRSFFGCLLALEVGGRICHVLCVLFFFQETFSPRIIYYFFVDWWFDLYMPTPPPTSRKKLRKSNDQYTILICASFPLSRGRSL